MGQLIDTAFSGSASGLVATLLDDKRLSADEARRIRELIERRAAQEVTGPQVTNSRQR